MQACIKPVKVSVVVWILKRFAEYHRELSWHIIKKKNDAELSSKGSGSVLHTDHKTRQNV